jgi:hypothetical protein
VFILVYGLFAVLDGVLMVRYGRKSLAEGEETGSGVATGAGTEGAGAADELPALTY